MCWLCLVSSALVSKRVMMIRLILLLCVTLSFVLPQPNRAEAIPPEILQSVVTVLPDWPRFSGNNGAGSGQVPEGSGIVVYHGGLIATNDHVLGRATSIRVRIWDGRIIPAKIMARDVDTDIALLQIDIDLPPFQTAPPPGLGGRVCAVGNPFGTGMSITCGVVSATDRAGMGFNPIEDFIQTDAAVNPGSSGGALVDETGRLVGMVSAIFTRDNDANIGINFAISAALLKRVTDDMQQLGRVEGGDLGMETTPIPAGMRDRVSGLVVVRVDRNSPALAAGIEAGDILTAVNGLLVGKNANLSAQIFMSRPGDVMTFTVVRGGQARDVSVTVGPTL